MALTGADASLFERYPAEGTPKLTVYREAQRASYLDLPVKTHDTPAMRNISGECRKQCGYPETLVLYRTRVLAEE